MIGIEDLNPPDVVAAVRRQGKRHKYNVDTSGRAKRARYADGHLFDSDVERDYYVTELRLLLLAGKIHDLLIHPRFELVKGFRSVSGKYHRPITYKADFSYLLNDGRKVVVDVKGMSPRSDFHLRRKLLQQKYPHILFQVVQRKGGRWVVTTY